MASSVMSLELAFLGPGRLFSLITSKWSSVSAQMTLNQQKSHGVMRLNSCRVVGRGTMESHSLGSNATFVPTSYVNLDK